MNDRQPPQGGLRFEYNGVFLPEYLSTVLISIPISTLFLATPQLGGLKNWLQSPHVPIACGLYTLIALALLIQTIYSRLFRYHDVQFLPQEDGRVLLYAGLRTFDLDEVDSAKESIGRMYGRTVRLVEVSDGRGWPVPVSECLFHYEQFKLTLASLIRGRIETDPVLTESLQKKVGDAWAERRKLFPPATTAAQFAGRFGWRLICLLPVAFMDLLINTFSVIILNGLKREEWMVYSAPLSLLLSCLVARYVYFYLFTSTVLNRPLET
ncbi:hypothetical protein [Thalassoroseus pseudoceratinae]|uniref:hypothetical protein n=1 Tax=Thalassoroseus pseudoceratinae TaxID=2713176 RepID=UPI001422EF7F|nr:hypothetical protein [Thalassoroseus pseudoceratinae]